MITVTHTETVNIPENGICNECFFHVLIGGRDGRVGTTGYCRRFKTQLPRHECYLFHAPVSQCENYGKSRKENKKGCCCACKKS